MKINLSLLVWKGRTLPAALKLPGRQRHIAGSGRRQILERVGRRPGSLGTAWTGGRHRRNAWNRHNRRRPKIGGKWSAWRSQLRILKLFYTLTQLFEFLHTRPQSLEFLRIPPGRDRRDDIEQQTSEKNPKQTEDQYWNIWQMPGE